MIRMSLETFNYIISAGLFLIFSFIGFWCCDVLVQAIRTHNRLKEILKDETLYR